MINYENLIDLLEDTDFSYFGIVSDSHEVFKDLTDDLTKVSSFFAVQKLVNKISLEEYTHNKYQKIEQDEDIVIEKEISHYNYKYMKIGSFKNLNQMVSSAITVPAMYVFIDSGNTFIKLSDELTSNDIPNLLIKYKHGKFSIDGKVFSSMDTLGAYLMKKYYL